MKRTFVVPEDKEAVYEKFKQLVPEVSSQLMEMIEVYVNQQEALQEKMTEQTTYEGIEYPDHAVFRGKTLKFYGVLLAKGPHEGENDVYNEVYLTKKGKFLVYSSVVKSEGFELKCYYKIYEDYFEMIAKAGLSSGFISSCEEYLKKNSSIRTAEFLDI